MIASLPMYQRPELAGPHARFWALIRQGLARAGIESPVELSLNGEEFAAWTHPSLVLSQTCSMPYRNSLHGRVTLICTPDYGLEGCGPGYYRSALIVRRNDQRTRVEDFATGIFSYNQDHSQSGFGAAYQHVTQLGFWFEHRFNAGHHMDSARAVADGRADIAAIDAMTWRLIERYDSFASSLRVIDWTEPSPGLPYISRAGVDPAIFHSALERASLELADVDREALGIRTLVPIPAEIYLGVEDPPQAIIDTL